jgi:hypothetical protein
MFQAAAGHNNTAGLTTIRPQPRCPGLLYPRIVYAADGSRYRDGTPYTEFRWDYLKPSEYAAILTLLGLSSETIYAPVTVRLIDYGFVDWSNYNATAYLPEMEQNLEYRLGVYTNVVLVFRELELIP